MELDAKNFADSRNQQGGREFIPKKKILRNSEIIQIRNLDHYTLICENAHAVAEFHVRILGFILLRTIDLNTGTVSSGDIDMKNYILQPPGNPLMTLVVTEGLNDETIFRRYMKAHGEGIHHIAFQVDDIEEAFALAQAEGIQTTSDNITTDMLSGLKQFFIHPTHSGFFIELVERPDRDISNPSHHDEDSARVEISDSIECDARDQIDSTDHSFYSKENMIDLSHSMKKILDKDEDGNDENVEDRTSNQRIFSPVCAEGAIEYDKLSSFFKAKLSDGVGALRSFGFSVKNPVDSMHFLLETFNLRFVRYNAHTGRIYVQLQNTVDNDSIFLVQAESLSEQRQAIVDLTFPDNHFPISSDGNSSNCVTIPAKYATYTTNLCSEKFLSSMSNIIELTNATDFSVQILMDMEEVIQYLSLPSNLTKWTGHKAIHFSSTRDEWLETRRDNYGHLVDYIVRVQREGDSVIFNWPERNLSMRFICARVASHHQFTKVQAVIPNFGSELRQAKIRRTIAVEIDLLKAVLEGDTSCISDHIFQQIQRFHLEIYGVATTSSIPPTLLKGCGFKGDICQVGELCELMSTDFACTIRSKPLAVLRPIDIQDVKIAIRLAFELGVSLVVRGSQVSHSSGGQSQSNGLLLDISNFSSIRIIGQASIRVGAGAMWNDVINISLKHGLMPPVVNDYQYLSVGGTISMGGVGFMSHLSGVQAAHVHDIEIVTGLCDVLHCSKNTNADIFNLARGGLGQFGVITSLNLPLVRAPKEIITLKIFFSQINGEKYFVENMERLVGLEIDMLHAFVKPSTKEVISAIVGEEKFLKAPKSFQNVIEKGQKNREIVYFVELGIYVWTTDEDTETFPGKDPLTELRGWVSSELNIISAVYFEEKHDFSSYLRRDPPVIKTNKKHGIVPHPSFAAIHSKQTTQLLLNKHIESNNRGDDGTNEILIMPLKDNNELLSGNPTPMFSFPTKQVSPAGDNLYFFILFLGSAIRNENGSQKEYIEIIRDHHRCLHNYSKSIGGKRYCYDTITSEVKGENSWKSHYGDECWEKIIEGKRKYDPYHLFQSVGLNIFS